MLTQSDKVFLLQLSVLLILGFNAVSAVHLAIIIGVYGGMIGLFVLKTKKE